MPHAIQPGQGNSKPEVERGTLYQGLHLAPRSARGTRLLLRRGILGTAQGGRPVVERGSAEWWTTDAERAEVASGAMPASAARSVMHIRIQSSLSPP